MKKSMDSGNDIVDSSACSLDEVVVGRKSSGAAVAGLAVGAVIGAAVSLAPADVLARGTSPEQLQSEAIMLESKKDYPRIHPNDTLVPGLTQSELNRGVKFMNAYGAGNLDTTVLYYLVRGSGKRSPDSRVKFNNAKPVTFGDQPVTLEVHAGYTLDQHLVQLVTGSYGNLFPPLPAFRDAGKDRQAKILAAMRAAIDAMGLKSTYNSAIPQGDDGAIAKLPGGQEVLLAGLEAAMGYSGAGVKPQNTVVFDITPPVAPKVGKSKTQVAQVPATQPSQDDYVANPDAKRVAKKADPCKDPAYSNTLARIDRENNEMMDDNASADEIRKSARQKYQALDKQCPDRHADGTHNAWQSLEKTLADYAQLEKDRIRLALFNVGGGFWTGGPLRNTGHGMLQFAAANRANSPNPFHFMAYLDGGNYSIGQSGSMLSSDRPFGDILLNFGGKRYNVELGWSGLWVAQQMAPWSNGPVTGAPLRRNITGGTEITTTTTEDSGSEKTDGYQLQNWMAHAQGSFMAGNKLRITIGGAFGQSDDSEISQARNRTSVTTVQDSEDQGPPKSTVHAENKTDVTVDTLTNLNVRTDHGAGKIQVVHEGSRFKLGGGLVFFYNGVKTSGNTNIDTNVVDNGTNVDIHIDGFPPQTENVAGSTTNTSESLAIPQTSAYSANIIPMLLAAYDRSNVALRLQMGPALGWNDQGFDAPAMPVAGNATGIVGVTRKVALGGNAMFYSNKADIDFLLSTSGDFKGFVGFIDAVNEMRTRSLASDRLVTRYLANMYHGMAEMNDGFLLTGGLRVDSEGDASGHGFISYVHRFKSAGPLGASVMGDSADKSLTGTLYVPLTAGLNLRLSGYTKKDDVSASQIWGAGGNLVFHTDSPYF